MELARASTYCCSNQATDNYNNHNYATIDDLCKKMNKLEEILVDLLAKDKCNKIVNKLLSYNNNHVEKQKTYRGFNDSHFSPGNLNMINQEVDFKIIHVGNKPSKRLIEPIDYSTMPRVSSLIMEPIKNQMISLKRKNYESCEDETDSNFDYKLIESKKFKCSTIIDEVLSFNLNKIKEQKSTHENLDFYEDMTEEDLWNLANVYNDLNEYKLIGIGLGLDKNDISIIESKYLARDGLKEVFYQVLLTWRLNQIENCSIIYFYEILKNGLEKSDHFIECLKDRLLSVKTALTSEKNENIFDLYVKKYNLNGKNDFKLSETELWDASGFMGEKWKIIGRNLGLNELDLSSIQVKFLYTDGIRECCYQTLLLWSQVSYEDSNFKYLCLNLIDMKFNLFAKQLIKNKAETL